MGAGALGGARTRPSTACSKLLDSRRVGGERAAERPLFPAPGVQQGARQIWPLVLGSSQHMDW